MLGLLFPLLMNEILRNLLLNKKEDTILTHFQAMVDLITCMCAHAYGCLCAFIHAYIQAKQDEGNYLLQIR